MSWADLPDDPDDAEERRGLPDRAAAAEQMTGHLQVQLPGLVERRVPVRGITPGPAQGVGRMRLADSTTFLIGGFVPGDLGRVLRALHNRYAVTIARWEREEGGLVLTLAGVPGREPVRVWLLGPDQPD